MVVTKKNSGLRAAVLLQLGLSLFASSSVAQSTSGVIDRYRSEVDRVVDRGLQYLASAQATDGSFPGQYGGTTGVAALAGMAFLAKGHTPGHGPYGEVINRCIDFVLKSQKEEDGYFGGRENGRMYSHNIASLFLSEVSGMVDGERQKKLDEALAKAVKLILTAQNVKKKSEAYEGGWRYSPDSSDSDMSCSGWALMALRSARLNGAPVPDEAIARAVKYIKSVQSATTGGFGYTNASGKPTLTGAGLLCLELTGHHGDPLTFQAGDYLLQHYHELPADRQAYYGLYYGAQGMFQLGGKHWSKFGSWMYEYWPAKQKSDGSWGKGQSPAYDTAMCVLSLTVPYRQLPIYQRDETVDEEPE